MVLIIAAIVVGIPAGIKGIQSIMRCVADDANRAYDREIDEALDNSALRELSSYVVETTSVRSTRNTVGTIPPSVNSVDTTQSGATERMVLKSAMLGDMRFERLDVDQPESSSSDPSLDSTFETIVPGSDGNLKTDTAVLIREKTKVTNHRRIMYRKRNGFTHSIVASVKLTMGTPQRDAANEKVVRKMVNDLVASHGINISDAAIVVPIAVELVFIPNDTEIVANQIRHSKRARERTYMANRGGETVREWMWRKMFANTSLQEAVSGPMYGPPCVEPCVD